MKRSRVNTAFTGHQRNKSMYNPSKGMSYLEANAQLMKEIRKNEKK